LVGAYIIPFLSWQEGDAPSLESAALLMK